MIDVDLYGNIRKLRNEGVSQRQIALRLGVSRVTVAKYQNGDHIPGTEEPHKRNESAAKEAIKRAMCQYYEKHIDNQTHKQKINGHTLWRDLHYEYPRSEATYRRYWAEIRGERQLPTRLPLMFHMAETAEVDWKMAKVRIRGREVKLHILCVNLMYGYTPFKKAYTNEKQYNLIDGLVSAIDFFGGAPAKFFTDNMVTARKKGYGKYAELTREFKRFAAHYDLEIEFANPGEPAEKGGVEAAAKTAGGILTPIMDVECISEVNDRLLKECLHYINHAGCIGNRSATVKEMTEQEKPFLTPIPIKRYEVGVHDKAVVNNQQLFHFDGFTYSIPRPYAGKEIGIIAYAFRVVFYYKGHEIWSCDRPFLEGENRVYAEHYLFDLELKPRAWENAFPLLEGILPPQLHRFRQLCKSKTTKCYQLYMLMQKMEMVGRDRLLKAVEIANAEGNPTYEKVQKILLSVPGSVCGEPHEGTRGDNEVHDEFFVEQRDPADYAALLANGH